MLEEAAVEGLMEALFTLAGIVAGAGEEVDEALLRLGAIVGVGMVYERRGIGGGCWCAEGDVDDVRGGCRCCCGVG